MLKKALTHETCCEHNGNLQQGFFEVKSDDWRVRSDAGYLLGLNLQGTVLHRVLKMDIPGFFVRAFPRNIDRLHRALDEEYVVQGEYHKDGSSGVFIFGQEQNLVLDLQYTDLTDFYIRHLAISRGFLALPEKGYRNGILRFGCRHYVLEDAVAPAEDI